MFKIIQNILNETHIDSMTHYKLNTTFIIDNDYKNIKTLLKNMNNNNNIDIKYYVSKTLEIDSINVIKVALCSSFLDILNEPQT